MITKKFIKFSAFSAGIILILFLFFASSVKDQRVKNGFLIPEGFVGWLCVDYLAQEVNDLPVKDGYRLIKIPASGYVRVPLNTRHDAVSEYYYFSKKMRKVPRNHLGGSFNTGYYNDKLKQYETFRVMQWIGKLDKIFKHDYSFSAIGCGSIDDLVARGKNIQGYLDYELIDLTAKKEISSGKINIDQEIYKKRVPVTVKSESTEIYGSLYVHLHDDFIIKLSETNCGKEERCSGIGLMLERLNMHTFSWVWYDRVDGNRYRMRNGNGELEVEFNREGDNWIIKKTKFIGTHTIGSSSTQAHQEWQCTVNEGSYIEWY